MSQVLRLLIDGCVAGALIGVLLLTFALDRPSPAPLPLPPEKILKLVPVTGEAQAPAQKPLRLGVTACGMVYDDMGKLLSSLGKGFEYTRMPLEDIVDLKNISSYDVIFLCCSTHPKSWLGEVVGAGARPDTTTYTWHPQVVEKIRANIPQYVGEGGTLYVSDQQLGILELAFPDFVKDEMKHGAVQELQAMVTDPGLRDIIGPGLPLKFPLPDWCPARMNAPNQTIYLQADYRAVDGSVANSPLLVRFPYRKGWVIFTSFHNEAQHSKQEELLLRYLVFGAVTAQAEGKAKEILQNAGFSPKKQNLISAGGDTPTVTKKHTLEKPGKLQFAVGWAGTGVQLRLTVTSPDGRVGTHEASQPFAVEVPEAPAGEWVYTLTALKLPSPEFPFSVTLGEK